MDSRRKRLAEAANRYIAADKSDPFAARRVYTHLANGLASIDADGQPHYDAKEGTERAAYVGRDGETVEYDRIVYTNRGRP